MDRNQAIGLTIMSALLLGYFWWSSTQDPAPAEAPPQELAADSTAALQEQPTVGMNPDSTLAVDSLAADSLAQVALNEEFGEFSAAAKGEEQLFTLENELVSITISSHGAVVTDVVLKEYEDAWGQPLYLVKDGGQDKQMITRAVQGNLDLAQLYYTAEQSEGNTLTLVASAARGGKLIHQFSLAENGYVLSHQLVRQGLEKVFPGNELTLAWEYPLRRLEKEQGIQQQKPTFNYYHQEEGYDEITIESDEAVEEGLEGLNYDWLTIKQKYFSAALITKGALEDIRLRSVPQKGDSTLWNRTQVGLTMEFRSDTLAGGMDWYYGPNQYYEMKSVAEGFGENVYLGPVVINLITKYLILPIFTFLDNFIGNYGIIIILLVLIIKGALFPLSYKSYLGMAKMRLLKPEIDKIKEANPDDNQKQQQEQLKLFQTAGVSPLSGCIPVVLQMPFLFAMFYFFPNSIELRQESFLWAHDLSTYDAVINLPFTIPFYGSHVSLFTLLMTLSTILYTWMNNQVSGTTGPMKNIGYAMPVVFMFVLNSFPAALSFYYFVSNIVTFSQQYFIRRFVDDSKIEKIMAENKTKRKAKAGGKTGFRARLEEMQKQQTEKSRQNQQKRKK